MRKADQGTDLPAVVLDKEDIPVADFEDRHSANFQSILPDLAAEKLEFERGGRLPDQGAIHAKSHQRDNPACLSPAAPFGAHADDFSANDGLSFCNELRKLRWTDGCGLRRSDE